MHAARAPFGRTSLIAAVALLVTLLVPAGACAAAPWSAPVDLTPGSSQAVNPYLNVLDGRLVLNYAFTHNDDERWRTGPPGGPFHRVPSSSALGSPVYVTPDRYLVAVTRPASREHDRLTVDTVTRGVARRGPVLDTATGIGIEDLVGDRRGDEAVAWSQCTRPDCEGEGYLLRVAVRRHGHHWGRPLTLEKVPSYGYDDPSIRLRLGRDGVLLVAWTNREPSVIRARVYSGGRWHAQQTLGPHLGFTFLRTAVSRNGAFAVAWGEQDGGEGVEHPWVVRAAMRPAGAERFGRAQTLDAGSARAPTEGDVALDMDAHGRALVAWTQMNLPDVPAAGFPTDKAYLPVRVAEAASDGVFGKARQVAPNGSLTDALLLPDGGVLVLWGRQRNDYGVAQGLSAAYRAPGARAFGPAEDVVDGSASAGRLLVDPRTNRPAASWAGASGPTARTAVYLSGRD